MLENRQRVYDRTSWYHRLPPLSVCMSSSKRFLPQSDCCIEFLPVVVFHSLHHSTTELKTLDERLKSDIYTELLVSTQATKQFKQHVFNYDHTIVEKECQLHNI